MTIQPELEVKQQCEQLVYRFLRLLEGEHTLLADLFTEDGRAFELAGRNAIRQRFADIKAVDHNVNVNLCSNLMIDVVDEVNARAENYVTHYESTPLTPVVKDPSGSTVGGELKTPRSITRWHWEFRRVADEWLVSNLTYPESVLLRQDVLSDLQ